MEEAPQVTRFTFNRFSKVFVLATVLAGCAATKQEVATNLQSYYVGKNVDVLVSQFGPPASTFRMNSGEIAYVWQLSALTSISANPDTGSGFAKTNYCKVNVITSAAGTITKLTTEDSTIRGNSPVENAAALAGADLHGSICAQHLGMRRTQ
jgi:hypothetical protein